MGKKCLCDIYWSYKGPYSSSVSWESQWSSSAAIRVVSARTGETFICPDELDVLFSASPWLQEILSNVIILCGREQRDGRSLDHFQEKLCHGFSGTIAINYYCHEPNSFYIFIPCWKVIVFQVLLLVRKTVSLVAATCISRERHAGVCNKGWCGSV